MAIPAQSSVFLPGFALRLVLLALVLFSRVLISVDVTPQTGSEPTILQNAFAAASAACPASVSGSYPSRCQVNPATAATGMRFAMPSPPGTGCKAGRYAAVRPVPDPAEQQMLRPPQHWRASV